MKVYMGQELGRVVGISVDDNTPDGEEKIWVETSEGFTLEVSNWFTEQ